MNGSRPHAIDIWLPDFGRFAPEHPLRELSSRADRLSDGARGYLGGLAERFDTTDPLPAGALTRQLFASDAGQDSWLCADPAWVQPDLNGARLLACGQMQLHDEEAHAFAQTLRPLFDEAGMQLDVSSPDHWHVRLPASTVVPDFAAPEQALGEDLYHHLPQGAEGRAWRVLLNEVQVMLHQHPLNTERRQRGLPPVNHLWLWGAGVLPETVHSALAQIVADDPLLLALAQQAGIPVSPRTAASVSAAGAGTLVDLQDLPVEAIAASWVSVLSALARRHSQQLSFASGERLLHRPWHRMRFWRGGAR